VCAGYWGLTYSAALAGFAARGWFGLKPVRVPAIERRQTKLEQRHASRRRPREAAAAHRAFRHEPHAGAGAPALTGAEAHR
jgi:hypothetical protein